MAKKVKKVPVSIETEQPPSFGKRVWNFFYNSGNIAWNWILGTVGALSTTALGVFGSIDWSRPVEVLKNGVPQTKEQWMMIGTGVFVAGLIGYATRVSGTKEVDGVLLPKAP